MAVQNAIDRLEAWRDHATMMLRRCAPSSEELYRNQRDNYQAVIDMLRDNSPRTDTYVARGNRIARLFMEQREKFEGCISKAKPADMAFAAASLTFNHGQSSVLEFCDYLQSKE